jgi:hypothetical protein
MSIQLGATAGLQSIKSISLGDTTISKVYLGESQVWPELGYLSGGADISDFELPYIFPYQDGGVSCMLSYTRKDGNIYFKINEAVPEDQRALFTSPSQGISLYGTTEVYLPQVYQVLLQDVSATVTKINAPDAKRVTMYGDALVSASFESVTILGPDLGGFGEYCDIRSTPISYLHAPNVIGISGSSYSPSGVNGCYNLISASFPLCTQVDGIAFEGCASLTHIDLPSLTGPYPLGGAETIGYAITFGVAYSGTATFPSYLSSSDAGNADASIQVLRDLYGWTINWV